MTKWNCIACVIAFTLFGSVLAGRADAQDSTAASCSGRQFYATGSVGATFTYYLQNSHGFPATARFVPSGWSYNATQFASETWYPFDDIISTDQAALLSNVRLGVSCFHFGAGYDTAALTDISGAAQPRLVVAETIGGGDPGGGDCWYAVRADDFGNPIYENGSYDIVEFLGCY